MIASGPSEYRPAMQVRKITLQLLVPQARKLRFIKYVCKGPISTVKRLKSRHYQRQPSDEWTQPGIH